MAHDGARGVTTLSRDCRTALSIISASPCRSCPRVALSRLSSAPRPRSAPLHSVVCASPLALPYPAIGRSGLQ
eukprot:6989577-Prymnesium_polylepis.1